MLLGLLGCGDVSNAVFLEDAEYVAALPEADRLRIALPWTPTATSPDLLTLSVDAEQGITTTLDGILAGTEALRALAPNERGLASRAWGPYPDAGTWVTAWVNRGGSSRFDWGFSATRDLDAEPVAYLTGIHYAGVTVPEGDGSFRWDHAAWGEVAGMETFGVVSVEYDVREAAVVQVEVAAEEPASSTRFAWRAADPDFQYRFDTELEGEAVTVDVRLRWTDTGARADAWLDGLVGSFGDPRWTQCWDGAGALTFEEDTEAWREGTGALESCPFLDAARPDALEGAG